MKNTFLLICFLLLTCFSYTQSAYLASEAKRSNTWLLGHNSDTTFSNCEISELSFLSGNAQVSLKGYDIGYYAQNASISDTLGNLLISTNGFQIQNKDGSIMENGDSLLAIVSPDYFTGYYPQGIVNYGSIILPFPNNPNLYYVIYVDVNIVGNDHPQHLYYSIVDMSLNNGLGKVIEKDSSFLQGDLDLGYLSATRHANGRDWWLIVPEAVSNCYYITLLTANGFSIPQKQCLGGICRIPEPGQMCFSPEGDKLIRCAPHNELNIYDFDRCNGLLSNAQYIQIRADTSMFFAPVRAQGVCVSPNNHFLYVSAEEELLQFDLTAADIAASRTTVAVYDGFSDPYYAPIVTHFFVAAPAVDGRIYLGTSSSYYVHIIDKPDLQGTACDVQQHALFLESFYSGGLPNSVYYGLGRLYNSPCDTLSTSISQSQSLINLSVYPNPTIDKIKLSFQAKTEKESVFEIYDVLGNLIKTVFFPSNIQEYEFSIEGIASGTYLYCWNRKERGKLIIIN